MTEYEEKSLALQWWKNLLLAAIYSMLILLALSLDSNLGAVVGAINGIEVPTAPAGCR
jgi:hypothetical protein